MLIIAIDTSTSIGSVALRRESGTLGLLTVSVDMTHSEGLMPAVDALLNRAGLQVDDITSIACVTGPGSYTGLRVGIATAQGLAFAKNLPCVGVPSLSVLAWAIPHSKFPLCPLLPARKGWLYAQLFEWQQACPEPLTDELNVEPDELVCHIHQPTVFFGPGLMPYREPLQEMLQEQYISVPDVGDLPRADILAFIAEQELKQGHCVTAEQLLPHYLGPSQAELNWKRRNNPTHVS